jgi:hypothetical protein
MWRDLGSHPRWAAVEPQSARDSRPVSLKKLFAILAGLPAVSAGSMNFPPPNMLSNWKYIIISVATILTVASEVASSTRSQALKRV